VGIVAGLALGLQEAAAAGPAQTGAATLAGKQIAWYPLTLSWIGPHATELDDAPNPFLDFRLTVVFRGPSQQVITVPGFFDGDGLGGGSGDTWRVRFAPDEGGLWKYEARFVSGHEIALNTSPGAGTPTAFDGDKGTFTIAPVDPQAPGFYSRGLLEYVGEHYLRFRDGRYFLKGGTDSPENFLGYRGFDNTFDQPGGASTAGLANGVHRYGEHVAHFGPQGLGDPDDPYFVSADTGYDSKGIVGALNYLARLGINSVYFLPMNMGGDGRETVPFVGYADTAFDKTHYDVSKLTQWNMVFEHATKLGILLHIVLAETEDENEQWLDGGALGVQRKLFFRELIARFGHNLAIKWNLSEENDFSVARLRQFADYIDAVDPYDHPIAFHTHLLQGVGPYADYDAVLGEERFTMTSLQADPADAGAQVEYWRKASAQSGHKWVIELDEISPADTGLTDDNAVQLRKTTLWDVYFSGGQIEWYLGYHPLPLGGDMRLEDFSTRQEMWIYTRHARKFMEQRIPFARMRPMDDLVTDESSTHGGAEVFAKPGEVYAVYFPRTSKTGEIDLSGAPGLFRKRWYSPRLGLFVGAFDTITGGAAHVVGAAPLEPAKGVRLAQNNMLVIEAESTPLTGAWVSETTWPGYTSDSYLRWTGPDATGPGQGLLAWAFEINESGSWYLRLHNRHNSPDPDAENDCYVRIDGGPWLRLYSNKGQATVGVWNWHTLQAGPSTPHVPPVFDLAAGGHTLEVSAASRNFMLDRMHLYRAHVNQPLQLSRSPSMACPGPSAWDDDWVMLLELKP
jgi:hypothetical protein